MPEWEVGPLHSFKNQGEIPLLGFDIPQNTPWRYSQGHSVEEVMSDNGVLKLMAIRRPEDRVLSAFVQKCVHFESYGNCPYMDFFISLWGLSKDDAWNEFRARMQLCSEWRDECKDVYQEFVEGLARMMDERVRTFQALPVHYGAFVIS